MTAAARRTPRERSGFLICPRDKRGRVVALDPLRRFAEKCEFEPTNGCVLWRGGTTSGAGNTATYGAFWADGRRWFAHRWAAVHIHRLVVAGVQVGHCCPCGPNTLCVQHVEPQTQDENLAEQRARLGGAFMSQSAADRQYWLFVALGIEQRPERVAPAGGDVPLHEPPVWLRPYLPAAVGEECPF
jgi:hypothetical protein